MEANAPKKRRFTLGMRTIKTLVATALVTLGYALWDRNPCFACIGAVFGMGSAIKTSLRSGGNRILGTVMGGLVAIPFYPLYQQQTFGIPGFVYLTLGLAVILILGQLLGSGGGIQPGAVVFFVVLLTVKEDNFVMYTLNRMIDTVIGVSVSLVINAVLPSPHEEDPESVKKALLFWKRRKDPNNGTGE